MVLTHLVHGIANSAAQSLAREPLADFSVRKRLIFIIVNEAMALISIAYHTVASAKYILHITAYVLHLTVREPQCFGEFCFGNLRPIAYAIRTSIKTPWDCLFAKDQATILRSNVEQMFGPRPMVKIQSPVEEAIHFIVTHQLPIRRGTAALIGITGCLVVCRIAPSIGQLGGLFRHTIAQVLSLWAPLIQTAKTVYQLVNEPAPNLDINIPNIKIPYPGLEITPILESILSGLDQLGEHLMQAGDQIVTVLQQQLTNSSSSPDSTALVVRGN